MGLKTIYLDNAATTPIDPEVVDAMLPYLTEKYGNPSASNGPGRIARLAVETARNMIASILNCKAQSIVFTSGGTESANTALRSAVSGLRLSNVISSKTEHACVLQTLRSLYFNGQASLSFVRLNNDGEVMLTDLDQLLGTKHGRSLVALMHANNETGASLNLALTREICNRHKAIFFSDSVQTIGHYPIDLSKDAPDLISAAAHKFHGPKGVGLLYVAPELPISPFITGGAQERGLRAGTENVASVVGMAKALELASKRYHADAMHLRLLKHALKEKLVSVGAQINGPDNEQSLFTVLNVRFPQNQLTENLLLELDMAGIAVSSGSACNSGKTGGSHVMQAIGAAESVNIRFSFSRFNTMQEVCEAGALLEKLLITETVSP